MAEEKLKKSIDEKRFFSKKFVPLFVLLGASFLILAVAVPLCIAYDVKVVLYALSATLALLVVADVVLVFILLNKYGKDIEDSLDVMDKQLDQFSKGDIKLSSIHHRLPSMEKLQDRLNDAIGKYAEYRLVYNAQSNDEELKKKIAAGIVFSNDEFMEHLNKEVENNLSFRSALLLIQSQGSDPSSAVAMEALHHKIIEVFPGSIVGRYDALTYVVYVYSVDSFLSLKCLCESFVANYNHYAIGVYEDKSTIDYCRLGGVVYPYTPITNLVQDAVVALNDSKGVNIASGVRSVYYPHAIVSENSRRVIYLASMERFQQRFRDAANYPEQIQTLKDFARWFALTADFEVGGVMLYSAQTHTYQIVMEAGKGDNDKSFSRLGQRIDEKEVDPFYQEALQDLSFSNANTDELPPMMSGYLNNLGIKSFYFHAVAFGAEKRGFIYLTSSKPRPYFTLLARENLNDYCALISSLLVNIDNETVKRQTQSLLSALEYRDNAYIYTIDRASYRLTYLSDNLKKSFPNAHEGDICYKVLRSAHTAPCSHCPLTHGADHRIIKHISTTEMGVSVLQFRGDDDNLSTIMMRETTSGSENLIGNHLIDEMLLIKNPQALSLDLARQIKLGGIGYVISVRLLESDRLLSACPGSDANSLMMAVSKLVQDAGYGSILYRYGPFELCFLLQSYTKVRIDDFVEEIAQELSGDMTIKDVSITPHYAYSAISYPTDARTPKELMGMIASELDRSASFGPGFVVEVANKKPRKALRSEYVLSVLKDTLSRDEMPIQIQPIYDASSHKIVAGDVLTRLYGTGNISIPPVEYLSLAKQERLISKIDLGSIRAAGIVYENYADNFFKNGGIENLSIYLSLDSLQDTTFPESVRRLFIRYYIPKNFMIFSIDAAFINKDENAARNTMNALADLGIVFEVMNYSSEALALDEVRKLGISRIKTPRVMIEEAVGTPSGGASFARFTDAILRGGFSITCTGIENEEENDLAVHHEIPRLQGYYFSHPLNEKDFISLLAYGK
jgi:EAL domain-containing protein (putative c-di-GMP-specific phosphodiesterase class I)